jgi:hypothetical protein
MGRFTLTLVGLSTRSRRLQPSRTKAFLYRMFSILQPQLLAKAEAFVYGFIFWNQGR